MDTDHQKKYFNNISDQYGESNYSQISFLKKIKHEISPYVKGDVLDIGNGGIISFDYKKAQNITLADLAVDLLKLPKAVEGNKLKPIKKNGFRIVETSVLKMPFAKNTFDVVLLLNVAHHLSVKTKKGSIENFHIALSEINRVLKKEGVLLLLESCPSFIPKVVYDLAFEMGFGLFSKLNKPLPYFFSEKQIIGILKKDGFIVSKMKRIKMEKGVKIYQPILPWFSPPGWVWDAAMKSTLTIAEKKTGC